MSQAIYRCRWCGELFVREVRPVTIEPAFHDPCPRANAIRGLDVEYTASVKGVGEFVAMVKEKP